MKTPKDITYILVECNYLLKPPKQMKGRLLMIYMQEYHSNSEETMKYSKFK